MKINRRHFCTGLAIGATAVASSTASAQSETPITGSISSSVGADVGGVELFFQQVETGSKWTYTVPESGDIDFSVGETGTYRVRLFDSSSRNDGVPVVYSFGRRTIESDGNDFTFSIPQAYTTRIRCVDEDGVPLEGLSIILRAEGTGQGGIFTTAEDGYVQFENDPSTAIQLAGSTRVEVQPMGNGDPQPLDTINVTESGEYEFVVSNPQQYKSNVELIEADPDAGFNYPYFLYTPSRKETDSELPLLVEPNNTGTSTDDFSKHQTGARELLTERRTRRIADELTVPALVPVFPRPRNEPVHWSHYTHHLDVETLKIESGPLERIDKQLINMIDHARSSLTEQGYSVTDDGVLLNGFSASGTFADRFTVLHPDEVLSVTAGGLNGMTVLPKQEVDGTEIPYHIGLANIESILGRFPDMEELDSTRQFLYMGGDDEKDTLPYDDAWTDDELANLAKEVYGEDMIEDRFPFCEEVYEETGIEATFKVYDGVGHTPRPAMNDIISFHEETVATYRESEEAGQSSSDSGEDTSEEAGQSSSDSGEDTSEEADQSSSDSGEDTSQDQTSGSAPGFGIGSGITALGGTGYMLKRRLTDESE